MRIFRHLAAVTPTGDVFITFRERGVMDESKNKVPRSPEADSVPDEQMSPREVERLEKLFAARACWGIEDLLMEMEDKGA